MKLNYLFIYIGLQLSFAFAQDASTQLNVADALGSNMVVQQNKPFAVWGTAAPNSIVSIKADWSEKITVTTDNSGAFIGYIPVPVAQQGNYSSHQIEITSGTESITLSNLLIGEVWICSGQSNMQFAMHEVINAEEELKQATDSNIRLFNTGLNFSDSPIETVQGEWQVCTPETAAKFSAVGYYFGAKLKEKLNIPIGLLFTGIGASAAQAYVPKPVLAADDLLNKTYLKPYLDSEKSKEKIDGGFSFEKVTRPYLLYNAMIHPFRNLSMRGVIWYQGEANRKDRTEYTQLMYAMINSWRTAFSQGDFPFYYVQIAPYDYDKKEDFYAEDGYFREAQEAVADLDHTEMVTTVDVGDPEDLHPKNKKPIGLRLAATALNRTYDFLDVPYQGPVFKYAEFSAKKAVVYFEPKTVTGGLKTTDGKSPQFFQLAGKDGTFHWADAKIEGKTIVVTSKEVKNPVAVRYAFTNYPVTNLVNGAEIPANPFRSDNWKENEAKK